VCAAMALSVLPSTYAAGAAPDGTSTAELSGTDVSGAADTGTAATEAEGLARAKKSGQPVEITSRREESSEVFANPDGSLEAREHLRPVRARVDGVWKDIDTGLARAGDGTVAPRATTIGLEFSGGGDAPMVRMAKAGRDLALSWPSELPTPQLQDDTATYTDVLPGVDLRLRAQQDGFTQLLVVKTPEAASSKELAQLRLKLDGDGMNVRETSTGGLEAVDKGAGGAVFEAPRPLMWDSSPGSSTQQPASAKLSVATAAASTQADDERGAAESGKLAPVDVAVSANQDELVLTPDAGVLQGEDTVYPVYIDPQWYTPKATAWTMASKYWAASPQWKFNGDSDAGMGYCGWTYCKPYDTKRLFYRIPVSKFAGKSVLSAEFVVRNTSSASCNARSVQLWRTKDISSTTTWNSQNAAGFWIDHLRTESFAHGYDGCAAKDAEFDVKSAVQQAADKKWPTMTFGLQASDETDAYGWKRFSDDAYLRVRYNRPPTQIKMSQLRMEYGGICKKPGDAARVSTLGTIRAEGITDPDGEKVAVQFQASWDTGDGKGMIARWKPALTSYKSSGSTFAMTLPASVPPDKTVNWYVRSYDGAQYSPWSYAGDPTACYFVYDRSVPKAPVISSGEYPASDPENPDDPWLDGVGKYGSFELKSSNSDVTKYWFGVNEDPTAKNSVTTSGGAARTVRVLPMKPGVNYVTARTWDEAGNGSEIRTYEFCVKAGQPERAMWQLDDATGATAAKGTAPERTAQLLGGATPGVPGAKGNAVSFDGIDDYAVTDIPTVDTSASFSVSAWAKLSELPDHAAIIAAQPGNHAPGFELYYSKSYDRWVFNQYQADVSGAAITRVMQPAAGGAQAGQWTHLVGTYSSGSDELKLYVNGALVGTTAYDAPWDARRGLQIGAGSYDGQPGAFFPGAIDEVQIFDKPLSVGEVTQLYGKASLTAGRPARAVFPLDEPADATQLVGKAEVPDATLVGGTSSGQPGVAGKALTLDGVDDYATTGRPLLNNQSSFAVSAWAKLPRTKPDHAAIVATQAGTHRPGMELYYSKSYDRWAVNQYSADASDATPIRAVQAEGQTAQADTWTHLVGVHDTVANKLVLYVNGVKAGETDLQAGWYAGGAVQIGAGSYDGQVGSFFPGQIDEVHLFDRPVSAEEVRQMFRQRPLVKSRWTFEGTSGTAPVSVPDAAGTGNALTMRGGANKSDMGWIDVGAMELDGATGYATAGSMPVDTSGSFTLTAWAQSAAIPDGAVALTSAEGGKQSAFTVRFVPDATDPENSPGSWELAVADSDAADATVVRMDNGQFYDARQWNHLALVYDGFAKQARLYVNGTLDEIACTDADGDGASDSNTCTDQIPWAENVLAFKATSLQIGRSGTGANVGSYFPGLVDDVWTFQGTLTDLQVEKLYVSMFDVPTEVPGD
jgi:Concanavalin A-like lectin/glucanases superfamily